MGRADGQCLKRNSLHADIVTREQSCPPPVHSQQTTQRRANRPRKVNIRRRHEIQLDPPLSSIKSPALDKQPAEHEPQMRQPHGDDQGKAFALFCDAVGYLGRKPVVARRRKVQRRPIPEPATHITPSRPDKRFALAPGHDCSAALC